MDKRPALLIAALAVLPAGAPDAQTLPLVSRDLQFHAAPGGVAGTDAAEAPRVSEVPVIFSTMPRTRLAPGAAILEPRVDRQTGLYIGNRGEPGRDPAILPEAPIRAEPEALPPLTVGQVYVPPWWDQVRNAAGGFGPADVPPATEVTPDDLRILPPPGADAGENDGDRLPATPPAAPPQRGAAQPTPTPQPAPAAEAAMPVAAPTVQPQPAAAALEQAPAPTPAPAPMPTQSPAAEAATPEAAPIPLVSRRLNFQY
jgi:hypothetical protein